MQNTDINSILCDSSEQYYEYLKANDKDSEETKLLEVEYDDIHNKINLRVRFTPKDMNNLQFRFGTDTYIQEQLKTIEFDEPHKMLILQLDSETFSYVRET